MQKITKQQIRIIHTLKSRLGMSDEQYRSMVQEVHGFSGTSKDLSFVEAARLITRLKRPAVERGLWQEPGRKYDDLDRRPGMASPAQLRMIEAMWSGVSYHHNRAKQQSAIRKFVFRIAGKSDLRFLTSVDARKVVNAIKNMKGRRHEKR